MKRIPIFSGFVEILSKKELKEINNYLQARFGAKLEGSAYLKSTKGNIYMTTRNLGDVDLKNLRISSIGLYIGEMRKGEFRLSIEGSQILGPKAAKGVIDIFEKDMKRWMCGELINVECKEKGYIIVCYGNDYLGSGRVKDGVLLNYVPKTRRVKELA